MAIQNEAELYAPLKAYFNMHGYDIKGEVRNCDMVGMKDGHSEPLIVEMKKTFNLALLLQGLERQKISPLVYLAVEKSRTKKGAVNQRWSDISHLCLKLGLGLITVTFYKTKAPFIEVLCEPGEVSQAGRKAPRKRERLLVEFRERSGDYNTGGVTRSKLVTAYREKALRVAAALHQINMKDNLSEPLPATLDQDGTHKKRKSSAPPLPKAGVTPAAIRNISGVGNAASILQQNYYGWFIRVAHGRYLLTDLGRQALLDYASILETSSVPAQLPISYISD